MPNIILAPIFYFVTQEPKRGQSEKQLQEILENTEVQFRFEWSALEKSLQTNTNLFIFAQGILEYPGGSLQYGL